MGLESIKKLLTSSPADTGSDVPFKALSWKTTADRSLILRALLVLSFFAAYLLMAFNSVDSDSNPDYLKRVIPYCLGIFGTVIITFKILRRSAPPSNKRIFVIWGSILCHLALFYALSIYCTTSLKTGPHFLLLILPYIFAPMITTVLLGKRMGIFTVLTVSFLSCTLVPQNDVEATLIISLITGCVTVITTYRTRSRSQLLRAGCYTGLTVLLMGIIYGRVGLIAGASDIHWAMLVKESTIAFCSSLFVAILLSGLFPLLEGMFAITTATGWLERCDLNDKLLGRLQMEAPGTFHHSLMVAQLAETAAEAIGANALECRVCSYYHDIGKLSRPEYFTENMADKQNSPHNALTPLMSAKILMKHVEDGVALAQKHNLERHIIATIREHHGTSSVSFLYQKALVIRDEMLEKVEKGLANPEDVVYPEEIQFHYPGPIPQSRETGIVSLADAVESASRSLNHPTLEEIHELVDRIIRHRVNEGQLDDSKLTFGDLKTIRQSFISTVKNMLHSRISYPKSATETEEDTVQLPLTFEGSSPAPAAEEPRPEEPAAKQ